MHESQESTAKRCSTKTQFFVYERRRMSCGVPRHWESAERKGGRDWCEVHQHQVITKGTKMGHPGLELSQSMAGEEKGDPDQWGREQGNQEECAGPACADGALIWKPS